MDLFLDFSEIEVLEWDHRIFFFILTINLFLNVCREWKI